MERNICVCLHYLNDDYCAQIAATAEKLGFKAHFYHTDSQLEEAAACVQNCEILFACEPELLRRAPATLKWYACAFAGIDPYCKDDGIFANPDCLMTNGAGAYGMGISEHVLMVTLELLRQQAEEEAKNKREKAADRRRGCLNLLFELIKDVLILLLGVAIERGWNVSDLVAWLFK